MAVKKTSAYVPLAAEEASHFNDATTLQLQGLSAPQIDVALRRSFRRDKIDTVDLWDCDLSRPETQQHLAEHLAISNSLRALSLYGCSLGDAGAAAIASVLPVATSLLQLSLQNNQVGDCGAQDLAHALRRNESLTYLDLQQNPISEEGAQHLASALRPHGDKDVEPAERENSTLLHLHVDNVDASFGIALSLERNYRCLARDPCSFHHH